MNNDVDHIDIPLTFYTPDHYYEPVRVYVFLCEEIDGFSAEGVLAEEGPDLRNAIQRDAHGHLFRVPMTQCD